MIWGYCSRNSLGKCILDSPLFHSFKLLAHLFNTFLYNSYFHGYHYKSFWTPSLQIPTQMKFTHSRVWPLKSRRCFLNLNVVGVVKGQLLLAQLPLIHKCFKEVVTFQWPYQIRILKLMCVISSRWFTLKSILWCYYSWLDGDGEQLSKSFVKTLREPPVNLSTHHWN